MRDSTHGTGFREHWFLFSRFLRSPRTVGALTASSRALAEAMVRGLDLSAPVRVVELGPGTGAFTSAIMARLGPHARFLAIDVEAAFVEQLRLRWPRLECVCASAESLSSLVAERHMLPVDHIISGLPFVSLPVPVTKQILEEIARSLRAGGTFTTFQYAHGYSLPQAKAFRHGMCVLMGGPPTTKLVLRNALPAVVLTWKKLTD